MNDGMSFSHFYLRPDESIPLSSKMRERLLAAVQNQFGWDASEVRAAVHQDVGVEVQFWRDFFRKAPDNDVLSAVTAIRAYAFRRWPHSSNASNWVATVKVIFEQEHANYVVTASGEVRYRHDREFSRNAAATIATLAGARYANALSIFESGQTKLGSASPDEKGSIRDTFSAVENIFRLMFPEEPRLAVDAARKRLLPLIQKRYQADPTALRVGSKQLSSFLEWIDACHFYRHEPGTEEPSQAPTELAIELVSVGAAFIRRLATLDKEVG